MIENVSLIIMGVIVSVPLLVLALGWLIYKETN